MKVLLEKHEILAKVKKLIAEVLNINEELITENQQDYYRPWCGIT